MKEIEYADAPNGKFVVVFMNNGEIDSINLYNESGTIYEILPDDMVVIGKNTERKIAKSIKEGTAKVFVV